MVGSLDHFYHFYNDCPAIIQARRILIGSHQHPDISIQFNQVALYPLREVDPYLLTFMAFKAILVKSGLTAVLDSAGLFFFISKPCCGLFI